MKRQEIFFAFKWGEREKIYRGYMYICVGYLLAKIWRPRGAHTANKNWIFSSASAHSFRPPMDFISVCGPRLFALPFLFFFFFVLFYFWLFGSDLPTTVPYHDDTLISNSSIRPTPIETITQPLTQCPKINEKNENTWEKREIFSAAKNFYDITKWNCLQRALKLFINHFT